MELRGPTAGGDQEQTKDEEAATLPVLVRLLNMSPPAGKINRPKTVRTRAYRGL